MISHYWTMLLLHLYRSKRLAIRSALSTAATQGMALVSPMMARAPLQRMHRRTFTLSGTSKRLHVRRLVQRATPCLLCSQHPKQVDLLLIHSQLRLIILRWLNANGGLLRSKLYYGSNKSGRTDKLDLLLESQSQLQRNQQRTAPARAQRR